MQISKCLPICIILLGASTNENGVHVMIDDKKNNAGKVPDLIARMHERNNPQLKQQQRKSEEDAIRERDERERQRIARLERVSQLDDVDSNVNFMLLVAFCGVVLFLLLLYLYWYDEIAGLVPERETVESSLLSLRELISSLWSNVKSVASNVKSAIGDFAVWLSSWIGWTLGGILWLFLITSPLAWIAPYISEFAAYIASAVGPYIPSWNTFMKAVSLLVVVGIVAAFKASKKHKARLVEITNKEDGESALPTDSLTLEYFRLRREAFYLGAVILFFVLMTGAWLYEAWSIYDNVPYGVYAAFAYLGLTVPCACCAVYLFMQLRKILGAMEWHVNKLTHT